MRSLSATLLFSASALCTVLGAGDAMACGGTFCDSGPISMPVDQTGENILFAMDGTSVEAHIQIQYQGEAARFAWVLPLPAVPEIGIGSQLLFVNLLNGTVPTFGYSTRFCGQRTGAVPPEGGGGLLNGGTVNAGEGAQVLLHETVGAFDVTVLQGGTGQEVSDWLAANGYQNSPDAPAILDAYVAQNFVFAAVKLTGGAGVDEIHPLVVRYPGNEPCVPLKLTAVAATEDMGVRAFFLGTGRVVPSNYLHIVPNPARFDWVQFAANYDEVISRAADSAGANGRAFVTEYAGPSNVVARDGIYSTSWRAAAFVSIAPIDVIDELVVQGIASCGGAECTFNHPLLLPLLHQYLPVPAGVDEGAFYSCLACYQNLIDMKAWDGTAFAVNYQERIVLPGRNANELLDQFPHLTRLYTTISPVEMTEDPLFHARPDLPDVTRNNVATQLIDSRIAMQLPGDYTVALTADGSWPTFDDTMPWVERVEEIPVSGPPIELVDNATLIGLLLEDANRQEGWQPETCNGLGGTGGGFGGSGGSGATAGSGASSGGRTGGASGSNAVSNNTAEGSGCACSFAAHDRRLPVALALASALLVGLRRRRRID